MVENSNGNLSNFKELYLISKALSKTSKFPFSKCTRLGSLSTSISEVTEKAFFQHMPLSIHFHLKTQMLNKILTL